MKWSQVSSALALLLVLVVLPGVAAVGRGSGGIKQFRANTADQGPSPAELEELEEDDGTQEQVQVPVMQQPSQQDNLSGPSVTEASSPVQPSSVPSLPSLIEEGVAGPSMSEHRLPAKDFQNTLPKESGSVENAEVDEAASSAVAPSMPAAVQPAKVVLTTPIPVIPGFPQAVPAFMKHGAGGSVLQVKQTKAFNPTEVDPDSLFHCHPPCIQTRGICNDNVCFCKSPYTGTTCQHKVGTLARFSYVMLVAFSVVSLVMGILIAQMVHVWVTSYLEAATARFGDGYIKQEVWQPPEQKKGSSQA